MLRCLRSTASRSERGALEQSGGDRHTELAGDVVVAGTGAAQDTGAGVGVQRRGA